MRRRAKPEPTSAALDARIARGELRDSWWLRPLRALARAYDTVEHAATNRLNHFAEKGSVQTTSDKGLHVPVMVQREASDITRQVGAWRGFHTAAARSGFEAYTDTYRIADVEASQEVAGRLGIPVGAIVLERARLQGVVVDGVRRPVQVATTWVVADVVARLPILREHSTGAGGMGSRMEEAGYSLGYEETVTARRPSPHEQEQLDVAEGQPVIVARRRALDNQGSGRAVEVTVRVINAERHELVYRYV
jgi:GntR family transcriptional regulator